MAAPDVFILAKDAKHAREIAKAINVRRQDCTYLHRLEQLQGVSSGVIVSNGSGDYSIYAKAEESVIDFLDLMETFSLVTILAIPSLP